MPGGDRTGPDGTGPMTGRAAGYCTGHSVAGYMNPAGGRGMGLRYGFGRGRGGWGAGFGGGFGGGGRGWRHRFYATGLPGWMRYGTVPAGAPPVPPEAYAPHGEREALRHQAQALRSALEQIQRRLDRLEAGAGQGAAPTPEAEG